METRITVEKAHITVEFPIGLDYWETVEAIRKVISLDEFPEKNGIWVFPEGDIRLCYDDLFGLAQFVSDLFPRNFNGYKTAIVVRSGFQGAVAETYIRMTEAVPREVRIFNDMQSAEKWVSESSPEA